MSDNELDSLQNLMVDLKPFLNRAEQLQQVRQMRNVVQADWLSNFMDTITKNIDKTSGADPTINKQTGLSHTVESMVIELSKRVGLDAISKTANKYNLDTFSAIIKLRAVAHVENTKFDFLSNREISELTGTLKHVLANNKEDIFSLSAKQTKRAFSSALNKINKLSELDDLNRSELVALLYNLSKTAKDENKADKKDLELISSYVDNKMIDTGNHAGLEQIVSGIMDERSLRELSAKLGRTVIKDIVSGLLDTIVVPDVKSTLPQMTPGAPGMRSQMTSGPNDPNRFMFTSSNPESNYG